MNDIQEYGLPESVAVLAETAPLAPIPIEVAGRLKETQAFFFATDARKVPNFGGFSEEALEDLPEDSQEASATDHVHWLAFGVRGRGLQGKHFDYFLLTDRLRLAVTLPWAQCYGDSAEEREALEMAFTLVRLCLAWAESAETRPVDAASDSIGPTNERLEVLLTDMQCRWRIVAGGESCVEGDDLMHLLDQLSTDAGDLPMRYWINV